MYEFFEIVSGLEVLVNTGETYVGHGVDPGQCLHHDLADLAGLDVGFAHAFQPPHDARNHLIDARYLIALAQLGGVAPPWEETPSVAKMEPSQVWRLRSWSGFGSLPVLVLSVPWLDRAHPDPIGYSLRKMLPVLKAMVRAAEGWGGAHATIGVFWDFMSLPRADPLPGTDMGTDGGTAAAMRRQLAIKVWPPPPFARYPLRDAISICLSLHASLSA